MSEAAHRSGLEQQTVERASRDPAFRQSLVSDPRGTMEREFGVTVPEGVQMTVLEETPSAVYLVLPPAPKQAEQELSDRDLESVAGGGWTGNNDFSCRTCSRTGCPGQRGMGEGSADPACP